MEKIIDYLPVLIVVAVLQIGLMAAALIHLLKNKKLRWGSVTAWVLIIVLINIIGPILYFTLGKAEE